MAGMRVGVNTLFLIPEQVGGSEIYVRHLLAAMTALPDAPEFVVFTNRENHDTFGAYERVLIDVPATQRWRRLIAEQRTLPKAAARANLDLLFSPGYTAPFRAPCPQVVAILDAQFRAVPEGFSPLSRAAQGFFIGGAGRRAARITTLSAFSKTELRDRLGIPENRIRVTHPGVDPLFFEPQPSPFEPPYILSVSNTYAHKNYICLARAYARIADRIPHRLIIAGQPRNGEPPAHPRIERVHHIPPIQVAGAMQACAAFVFPSRYEGFGLPVAEAMAAGAPVAAARAGSIPEVAGDHALYFHPDDESAMADAMLALISEPDPERQARIDAARTHARQFTWPRCAETTLAAFYEARGKDLGERP